LATAKASPSKNSVFPAFLGLPEMPTTIIFPFTSAEICRIEIYAFAVGQPIAKLISNTPILLWD
jgi:hypothetical protein